MNLPKMRMGQVGSGTCAATNVPFGTPGVQQRREE
jgi:hypothetical protein